MSRFSIRDYPIFECPTCNHRFAGCQIDDSHVERVYGDAYFTDGGAGYSNYLDDGPALIEQGAYYGRLLSRYAAPARILDVGAAAGFIMKGLRDCGWQPSGIEPNATMAQHARNDLAMPVEVGTLEDYASEQRFNAISMIQVLGHFVDPTYALQKASSLLRPSGLILTETWDHHSLWARFCGPRWHEYSPPSVLHFFSRSSLTRLMHHCGLELVAWGARHKIIRAGHAHSLAQHVYGSGAFMTKALARLPEHLGIPYFMDDLFWAIWRPLQASAQYH